VHRRDNIKYVEPGVLLYVAGNFLVTLDLRQDPPTRGYVKGVDGGGIGAFVVHPTEPLVVVGEKGNDPNLYIFHYPSWELAHVLRKGAEQGYSTLSFSPDGEMLASVAEGPDYILSVWDWRRERVTVWLDQRKSQKLLEHNRSFNIRFSHVVVVLSF